jgi:hypothetical protein
MGREHAPEVWASLSQKVVTFLKGLTEEEAAAFATTLSEPIQRVDLEIPDNEVVGYSLQTLSAVGSQCQWVVRPFFIFRDGRTDMLMRPCFVCNGVIQYCAPMRSH